MDNIFKWLGFGLQCLSILIIPLGKSWFDKFTRFDLENQKNIENTQKELEEFKRDVSETYLKRDEYLTVSGNLLNKMDEITKVVYEIKGELKNKKY